MERETKPLVRCPACDSRLIYPVQTTPYRDGLVIIRRRCPECEHRDCVTAHDAAVVVWLLRQRRIRSLLIRHVLELQVTEALGESASAIPPA